MKTTALLGLHGVLDEFAVHVPTGPLCNVETPKRLRVRARLCLDEIGHEILHQLVHQLDGLRMGLDGVSESKHHFPHYG